MLINSFKIFNCFVESIYSILTHLAYRANAKTCDISNNNSQFRKLEESACQLTSFAAVFVV